MKELVNKYARRLSSRLYRGEILGAVNALIEQANFLSYIADNVLVNTETAEASKIQESLANLKAQGNVFAQG